MTADELAPFTNRLLKASLAFHAHGTAANRRAWHAACDAYTAEQREMAYQAGSFGCDIDAETARQDLRDADVIIDVCKLPASIDKAMMLARGCRLMAEVKRLDGRLVGFSAREQAPQENGT